MKNLYNKFLTGLGMLMAGVVPSFASDLSVNDFESANLQQGLQNVESGTKTTVDVFLNIILWIVILLGVVFFFWGAYLAASKDQREEGKLKDGIKLALLGVIFIGSGFVIRHIAGL